MALSTENSLLVWQKVKVAMEALEASEEAKAAFKALKARLSTIGGNKDLQFVPISDLSASDTVLADAACTLYGVYFKKQATSTAAYAKLNDSATTCGGANGAGMTDCFELNAASQELFNIFKSGRVQGSGLAACSQTAAAGDTDSTSGDGPNGFVIIGA